MRNRPLRLGLLGGTLDPVHHGHLDAAEAARLALRLDQVWLLPSHLPPHRPAVPIASPFHRFALASLAIAGRPSYRVSDMELGRTGPSYTVDTLRNLHAGGWTPQQLFFILGTDAFAEIASWHEYPAVLDAAHFVVIARPGTTLDGALSRTPMLRERACQPDSLPAGQSGTHVILVLADTRPVSSTEIRTRRLAGQPIDDLVPSSVDGHIRAHHLYEPVGDLHG